MNNSKRDLINAILDRETDCEQLVINLLKAMSTEQLLQVFKTYYRDEQSI